MAKTPPAPAPETPSGPGKNRPTPSRAEQEAARKRPLVPDTKEARARAKADLAQQREKARVGMAAGDDKYLPAKDKGPQRRFVRDYVDARWNVGEVLIPLMVIAIVVMMINTVVAYYAMAVLWVVVLITVIDMALLSVRIKRAARAKFGENRIEKGLGWYGAMRSFQMRFMRLPKPQFKRGQKPA